jgi:multimeric flavodoxin WrbA
MEYKPFSILFKAGLFATIIIFILAITTFFLPRLSKQDKPVGDTEKRKIILHDLDAETAEKVFKNVSNAEYISASKKIARCFGCFGCWLKTPSLCVMHDGAEAVGKKLLCCNELIIISKNLYGGFSKNIKNVLDRSISFALPFFAVRNKEQHHQLRYKNNGKLKACIYNSNEIPETDRLTLKEIARANAVNMNLSDYETIFVNDVHELCEVLK